VGGAAGGPVDAGGVVPGPVRIGLSPPRRASRVTAGAKPGVEAEAARVPSGGRRRGEDRREAAAFRLRGGGQPSGVMGERE